MDNVQIVRAAVARALCEHFDQRRSYGGDLFATEAELENLKSDPIGNLEILDYDTRRIVQMILAAAGEVQEHA